MSNTRPEQNPTMAPFSASPDIPAAPGTSNRRSPRAPNAGTLATKETCSTKATNTTNDARATVTAASKEQGPQNAERPVSRASGRAPEQDLDVAERAEVDVRIDLERLLGRVGGLVHRCDLADGHVRREGALVDDVHVDLVALADAGVAADAAVVDDERLVQPVATGDADQL